MAQLVALMSGVVLGGVAEVVGSNLARGKIFTASIGSVDSLYPYVYIHLHNFTIWPFNLPQRSRVCVNSKGYLACRSTLRPV